MNVVVYPPRIFDAIKRKYIQAPKTNVVIRSDKTGDMVANFYIF